MSEVNHKLSKLDMLDGILNRIGNIEKHCKSLSSDMDDMKRQLNDHAVNIDRNCNKNNEMGRHLNEMYEMVQGYQRENFEMREKLIESQTRSMRDNLIFKGIPDVQNETETEDTEAKVKEFIVKELGVEADIHFHVVHRLKRRQDGGHEVLWLSSRSGKIETLF